MSPKAIRHPRQLPLKVEIPSRQSEEPNVAAVAAIGVFAFLAGVFWPKVAGVSFGPAAPRDTEGSAESIPSASPNTGAVPQAAVIQEGAKPNLAPAVSRPVVSADLPKEPTIEVRRGAILNCRGADGEKREGKACGILPGFDEVAMPRIKGLAKCPQALGLSGKLSVLLDLDFTQGKTAVHFGKSTTVGNEFSLGHCLRISMEGAKLRGLKHDYDRYTVAYNATFSEPTRGPTSGIPNAASTGEPAAPAPAVEPTSPSISPTPPAVVGATPGNVPAKAGEMRVVWEVAIVRDAAKTGEIVARLPKGSPVRYGTLSDGWYPIKYGKDFASEGWVYRGAIAP